MIMFAGLLGRSWSKSHLCGRFLCDYQMSSLAVAYCIKSVLMIFSLRFYFSLPAAAFKRFHLDRDMQHVLYCSSITASAYIIAVTTIRGSSVSNRVCLMTE